MKASQIFQLMAFTLHTVAFIALLRLENHTVMNIGFGSYWKFFTIWTHTLNVIFYALCVLNMLPKSYMSWIFKMSFTCSVCVSAMFWGILFLDPTAFKIDPNVYPNWLNHAQHTVPCITATLELILVEYMYGSLVTELAVILCFAGSYLGFALYLKKVNGWYPYPFMEQFSLVNWVVFAMIAGLFAVLVHIIGRSLSQAIHLSKKNKKVGAQVRTGGSNVTTIHKQASRKSRKVE